VILAQLAHFASHTVSSLAFLQEGEQTVSFSPMGLWEHMGWLARAVAIILFIESIWSLAVMIDRYLYFSAARKQSREFAPKVAGALKDSKLEEAIKIAEVRHVSLYSGHIFPDFLYRRRQLLVAPPRDVNRCAFVHKLLRRCETDAAGAARDQCNFSFKSHVRLLLF